MVLLKLLRTVLYFSLKVISRPLPLLTFKTKWLSENGVIIEQKVAKVFDNDIINF